MLKVSSAWKAEKQKQKLNAGVCRVYTSYVSKVCVCARVCACMRESGSKKVITQNQTPASSKVQTLPFSQNSVLARWFASAVFKAPSWNYALFVTDTISPKWAVSPAKTPAPVIWYSQWAGALSPLLCLCTWQPADQGTGQSSFCEMHIVCLHLLLCFTRKTPLPLQDTSSAQKDGKQ